VAATENAEGREPDRIPDDQIIAAVHGLAEAERAYDDARVAKEAAEEALREAGFALNRAEIDLRHLRRLLVRS
jgi:hypothetical protein